LNNKVFDITEARYNHEVHRNCRDFHHEKFSLYSVAAEAFRHRL